MITLLTQAFNFLLLFARQEWRIFHLKSSLPNHQIDKSLLVSDPDARDDFVVEHCVFSLNGIFITYLAFPSQHRSRNESHRSPRRKRIRKAKHWALQLMYDNYVLLSLPKNIKPWSVGKGANFRKIRRIFFLLLFLLPLPKQIFADEIKLPVSLTSPLVCELNPCSQKGSQSCWISRLPDGAR